MKLSKDKLQEIQSIVGSYSKELLTILNNSLISSNMSPSEIESEYDKECQVLDAWRNHFNYGRIFSKYGKAEAQRQKILYENQISKVQALQKNIIRIKKVKGGKTRLPKASILKITSSRLNQIQGILVCAGRNDLAKILVKN